MKQTLFLFAAGALLTGATAAAIESPHTLSSTAVSAATQTGNNMTNLDDQAFMEMALSSNEMEIQLGRMALTQSSNQQVKDFAQMMVDHHTKAKEELRAIASDMGVSRLDSLMTPHQDMIGKMGDYTGDNFDEEYMDTMEKAHKMDVEMYEAKSQHTQSQALKDYISKTLPTLREHEQKANQVEDGL